MELSFVTIGLIFCIGIMTGAILVALSPLVPYEPDKHSVSEKPNE